MSERRSTRLRRYLLVAAPIVVAVIAIVVLSFPEKATHIQVDGTTSFISFRLVSAWRRGMEIEVIPSIESPAVQLLLSEGEQLPVAVWMLAGPRIDSDEVDEITFVARSDFSRIVFMPSGEAGLLLQSLIADAGSRLSFLVKDGQLDIGVDPHEETRMSILPRTGSLEVRAYDCDLLDGSGTPITGADRTQLTLTVWPSLGGIEYASGDSVHVIVRLGMQERTRVFTTYPHIDQISFVSPSEETAMGPFSGTVRLLSPVGEATSIESAYLEIRPKDTVSVVDSWIGSSGVDLLVDGIARSVTSGLVPGRGIELLPTLLEWIRGHQQLGVGIVVLGWVTSAVFGALKLGSLVDKGKEKADGA